MQIQPQFDKYVPFVRSEAWQTSAPPPILKNEKPPLAITISRQTGSGAHRVADCLAHQLQTAASPGSSAWTVFDHNLIERVLEDHNLPSRLARFLPEDRVSTWADTLDELLGLHPPTWTMVERTAETILRLAKQGHTILIGRGAHVITRNLPNVFHVRLVGSLERRIGHLQETRGLSREDAYTLIRQEDRGRRRYLKKYFGKDHDDPVLFDMVVNTDALSYERTARLIAEAALDHLGASHRTEKTAGVRAY
jgi:cytidylate kinase